MPPSRHWQCLSNPVVIDTLGLGPFKDGRFDAALLKLLRDARLRAPANPEIRFHLASALAQSGKRAGPRELVNAFRDHPHFPGEAEAKALLETLK